MPPTGSYPPASAGSGLSWSSGSSRAHRNNVNNTASIVGGRSIVTAGGGGVSRSIRPSTGLSRVEKVQAKNGSNGGGDHRIIESVGYYQSMLQNKIEEIADEIGRLRSETEMADGESEPRKALERRYEDALKTVQDLENTMTDYNLAKESIRSGSDIASITRAITSRNSQTEKEIDSIFFSRKKTEAEIERVQSDIKSLEKAKFHDSDEDNDDLSEYRALMKGIEDVIEETRQQEDDILLLKHKLRQMNDGFHSEYLDERKRFEDMQMELKHVEEEIKVAHMTEAEAHTHLNNKLNSTNFQRRKLEDESSRVESELQTLWKVQTELRCARRKHLSINAESFERLLKKDQDVRQYLEYDFPEMKSKLENERLQLLASIESLRVDIAEREKMTEMELPTKDEMELMKDEVTFTGKHLDASHQTMSLLEQQKKSRTKELERITGIEERIKVELEELGKRTIDMKQEMEMYSDQNLAEESAKSSRQNLLDTKEKLIQRIEILDSIADELNSSDRKELEELKSKFRSVSQAIVEMQERAKASEANDDYVDIKDECLRLCSKCNEFNIQVMSQ